MATYTPPTELLPIFDSSVYVADTTPLTIGEANKKYVKYPTAQGLTTFPSGLNTTTISSTLTTVKNLWNDIAGYILMGDQSAIIGIGGLTTNTYIQNIESSIGTIRKLWATNSDEIDIGTYSSNIVIGTNAPAYSLIGLGNASTVVRSYGALELSTINTIDPTFTMNIGTFLSSGLLNLGTYLTRSGVIHIGDGESSTGGIHINNGSSASGNTQIMNGTSQSGNLNLGGVGNTVNINVNRPLTINYNPSSLSTGTQIGYTFTPTVTWTTSASSSICSQSLTQGIYQLNFSITTTGTFVDNFIYLYNTTSPSPVPSLSYRIPFIRTASSYNLCSGSSIVKMTTTQTLYLANYAANSQTGSNGEVYITRIG
jgi:hypothetical protein